VQPAYLVYIIMISILHGNAGAIAAERVRFIGFRCSVCICIYKRVCVDTAGYLSLCCNRDTGGVWRITKWKKGQFKKKKKLNEHDE